MPALVICAFPGCGKSMFYKLNSVYEGHQNGLKVLDSDSSSFSWLYDDNGKQTTERNPNFPANYISHIKSNLKHQDIIFVSSHKLVREALQNANIPYINIYPADTIDNMKEWRNRFINRGNPQSFIDLIMTNWSVWLMDMELDKYATKNIALDVNSIYPYITYPLISSLKE